MRWNQGAQEVPWEVHHGWGWLQLTAPCVPRPTVHPPVMPDFRTYQKIAELSVEAGNFREAATAYITVLLCPAALLCPATAWGTLARLAPHRDGSPEACRARRPSSTLTTIALTREKI